MQPPFIAPRHENVLCDGERCEIACVTPFPQDKNPGGGFAQAVMLGGCTCIRRLVI